MNKNELINNTNDNDAIRKNSKNDLKLDMNK
jgi:hypothetical protein